MSIIIDVKNIDKSYQSGGRALKVLDHINFSVNRGESLAIIGPSGSGKTTLLGLCAGLDSATEGEVVLDGQQISTLTEDDRADFRSKKIGFIFQNFQLIPTLTALENVMIPMELKGMNDIRSKAMELLKRVGLGERYHHYPSQLSGGEQQRVSLARAFSNEPSILFADEPTGNLDEETSGQIEQLMFDMNREKGTTLVIVTHNPELAKRTERILTIKGGKLISDVKTEN